MNELICYITLVAWVILFSLSCLNNGKRKTTRNTWLLILFLVLLFSLIRTIMHYFLFINQFYLPSNAAYLLFPEYCTLIPLISEVIQLDKDQTLYWFCVTIIYSLGSLIWVVSFFSLLNVKVKKKD
jgi:hypothetical protein